MSKDSAPILLLHGTQDSTVPIAQSELLLARYQKAGASAEFLKVEGATHAFWNDEWFDDTVRRSVEFFRKQSILSVGRSQATIFDKKLGRVGSRIEAHFWIAKWL